MSAWTNLIDPTDWAESFRCRCPEPDRPGWMHRAPIECSPLAVGETIEEWRGRRYEGKRSPAYDFQLWMRRIEDGYASIGDRSIAAATAEDGCGHAWDQIVLGSDSRYDYDY